MPVIKDKPKIIKIIKKKTVVIECVVVSKFAPKCIWFKEKNEVSESQRHRVDVKQVKEGEFAVQLEITNVQEDDKGSYQMVAKNEKGEAVSQTVELVDIPESDADEKPAIPEIRKRLRDETIEETRTVELVVELKKTLKNTKVVWYKDSTIIRESIGNKQTFDGKTATLRISRCKKFDSGTYKCVIKNDSGMDECSASLTIKKVEEKKKKKEEEENVEETIQVDEDEEEPEEKLGPFDVKLKKAKQNKTVITVSNISVINNIGLKCINILFYVLCNIHCCWSLKMFHGRF